MPDDSDIIPDLPNADELRRRLAVVLTEAGVLRKQIKVAAFLERERARLRKQKAERERQSEHAEET